MTIHSFSGPVAFSSDLGVKFRISISSVTELQVQG